jgi:hypothetical protein
MSRLRPKSFYSPGCRFAWSTTTRETCRLWATALFLLPPLLPLWLKLRQGSESPMATPETVPVNTPVTAKKTGLLEGGIQSAATNAGTRARKAASPPGLLTLSSQ